MSKQSSFQTSTKRLLKHLFYNNSIWLDYSRENRRSKQRNKS